MARTRRVSILLAVFAVFAFVAQAQMHEPPAGGGHGPGSSQRDPSRSGPPRGSKGPPTRELTELLGLDQKQSVALETVLRERHEQMRTLRQRADEARNAAIEASDERVRKLLTPAQFGTFKQWESQHRPPSPGDRQRHGGQGPDGEGGPPPTPRR
jgi:hypothetical protein